MDYLTNDTDLKKVADAIRAKGNTTDPLAYPDEFVTAIGNIQAGGGSVSESDITFYDYEGTIVESWTLAELANKTALPAYPSHEGLICQGWNWSLADLKTTNRKMNVGAMYTTDDGKTRIYIHLEEGRTSPMLGVCPNGTVTVDWGDGTTPDTLTGTSTSTVKWTPTHNYAAPGDYVIKLTVSETMGFYGGTQTANGGGLLRYSTGADWRNASYQNSIQKVELGRGVASIEEGAFASCSSLASIAIPTGAASIGTYAFYQCYSLASAVIPDSVTSIGASAFASCSSLASVATPAGVTSFGDKAFNQCYSLPSITIPEGVTSFESRPFGSCHSLATVTIPIDATNIAAYMVSGCYSLRSFLIPVGVTHIGQYAFQNCQALTSVAIPAGVTNIMIGTFFNCRSVAFYDFSNHTAVPTLANVNAFANINADCEIRVPAALVDEWKAATNWATYADHIVGV